MAYYTQLLDVPSVFLTIGPLVERLHTIGILNFPIQFLLCFAGS